MATEVLYYLNEEAYQPALRLTMDGQVLVDEIVSSPYENIPTSDLIAIKDQARSNFNQYFIDMANTSDIELINKIRSIMIYRSAAASIQDMAVQIMSRPDYTP